MVLAMAEATCSSLKAVVQSGRVVMALVPRGGEQPQTGVGREGPRCPGV